MNKKMALIILLFFTVLNIYSDDNSNLIEDKLSDIAKSVDYLQDNQNELEEENVRLKEMLDRQDLIFDRFVTIFNTTIALITLLGIVFPIVTYFFNIKPAKEINKTIRESYDRFQKEAIDKNILDALNDVMSDDNSIRDRGYTTLNSHRYHELSKEHKNEIYSVLTVTNKNEIEDLMLTLLANSIDDKFIKYIKKNPTNLVISKIDSDKLKKVFVNNNLVGNYINKDKLSISTVLTKLIDIDDFDLLIDFLDNFFIEDVKIKDGKDKFWGRILDYPTIRKLSDIDKERFQSTRMYKIIVQERKSL